MRNELEKGGGVGRAGGDRTGGSLELGILPALCPGGFPVGFGYQSRSFCHLFWTEQFFLML